MVKDVKISGYQLVLLLIAFVITSTRIFDISYNAGRDVWLAYLISWAGCLVLMGIYLTISSANASKTLIEILQSALGRRLGNIVSLCYIWYFVHIASFTLGGVGDILTRTAYLETPELFILGCLGLLVAYTAIKGLEVFCRVSEIAVPLFFLILVIIICFQFSEFNLKNILPVLENGLMPILQVSLQMIYPFGELIIFLMIFPSFNQPPRLKKMVISTLLIFGFGFTFFITLNIFILGPDLTVKPFYPQTITSELIPHVHFNSVIVVIYAMFLWIKAVICIYAAGLGIAQVFNTDDYKPFILPITSISVCLSILIYTDIPKWFTEIYPFYVIPYEIIIPVLLLVIIKIKGKLKPQLFKP